MLILVRPVFKSNLFLILQFAKKNYNINLKRHVSSFQCIRKVRFLLFMEIESVQMYSRNFRKCHEKYHNIFGANESSSLSLDVRG